MAAIVAAAGIATVFSADPRRSAGAVMLLGVYVLVYYLTADLLAAGWPGSLIVRGLLFAGSFVIAFGILELVVWYGGWLAISGWSNPLPPATLRVRAFLGHPNFVAALFSLLLPLALGAGLIAEKRGARWLAAGWVISAAVVLFFTSSRGGWLGTAAGVVALALLAGYERRAAVRRAWQALRRRPWTMGALAMAVLAVIASGGAVVYIESQHPTHAGRDYIWDVAWKMFQRHPLTGNGPFTFGTEFIHQYSVPPEVLLAHAHNFFINTLAETGLIGAAAWVGLGIAVLSVMRRRWQALAGRERLEFASVAAALVAMMVTSLFDTPQLFPAMSVFCAILLALATAQPASAVAQEHASQFNRRIALGNIVLTAGWLAICAGLAWSLRAYRVFSSGVLAANLDRWAEAGTTLDEAAQLDSRLAFYWLQAGYAHGQAGLRPDGSAGDTGQVSEALADFERGLALEPYLATNWANVGVLRWAAGDDDGAQKALEVAVSAAPGETPFRLTLGRLYEARGNVNGAREAFAQVLAARPEWSDTYFFRATPLRQAAAADWRAQNPAGWLPGGAPLAGGWASLEAGQFDAARGRVSIGHRLEHGGAIPGSRPGIPGARRLSRSRPSAADGAVCARPVGI
jgi:O-antigen ligase